MATRRVYTDEKGSYFKGEGFIFRLPHSNFGTHVEVEGVSCGQSGAGASYRWHGKLYFVTSEPVRISSKKS